MAKFDIKLGIKDGDDRNIITHFVDGAMPGVVNWLSEKLGELDKTIHDIFHLEIREKD